MKKNVYIEPTLRVVEIELHKLMAGSPKITKVRGGDDVDFQENILPGDGTGSSTPRSSEWYGKDEDYEEEW